MPDGHGLRGTRSALCTRPGPPGHTRPRAALPLLHPPRSLRAVPLARCLTPHPPSFRSQPSASSFEAHPCPPTRARLPHRQSAAHPASWRSACFSPHLQDICLLNALSFMRGFFYGVSSAHGPVSCSQSQLTNVSWTTSTSFESRPHSLFWFQAPLEMRLLIPLFTGIKRAN